MKRSKYFPLKEVQMDNYKEKEKEFLEDKNKLGWVDPIPGINFDPYTMTNEEALKELRKLEKKIEKDSPQLFKKYKQMKELRCKV